MPLALLYLENSYGFILALILFNNIMDDLDGILAAKLNIRSRFGADLDNVCDAVAHVAIALAVGVHFGGMSLIASLIASAAIILRATSRLNPDCISGGSPTNELMRHVFFVLLLSEVFSFNPQVLLTLVFVLNTFSMSAPILMPTMIRSQAKTASLVAMVNIALVCAYLLPDIALYIALVFFITYLYALITGSRQWIKVWGAKQ